MLIKFLLDNTGTTCFLQTTFFLATGLSIAGGVIGYNTNEASDGLLVWGLSCLGMNILFILFEILTFLYPFFTTNHSDRILKMWHFLQIIMIVILLLLNLIFFVLNMIFLVISHGSCLVGDHDYLCGTIRDICLVLEVYLGLLNFVSIVTLIYGVWFRKLSTWLHN
jgi:hypothetical protein